MARTRFWTACISGLVQWGGMACTQSDPLNLRAQDPLVWDGAIETLSLDSSQVPVVASCTNGQIVQKTGTGWSCVNAGPGGTAVTWETVTEKPATFPPMAHAHAFTDLTGVPAFASAGDVTTAQNKLTQLETRVATLEGGGGSSSTFIMSSKPNDSVLTAGGYSVVGLGRAESFATRSTIPTPSSHVLGAAVLGTKVYMAGGYVSPSQQCITSLREYDLVTTQWTEKQQMPTARNGQVAVGAGGKVYEIGGWCNGGIKTTEIYDPQRNVWTTGAPLPDHNHHGAAYGILSDGKLHVVGGTDHTSGSAVSASHVVYDFGSNTWTEAAALPAPRYWAASGVLDGKLIVAGGFDGTNPRAEVYLFDPNLGSWTALASMPTALRFLSGAVIAGRFHTFLGHNGSSVDLHYIYDPATNAWSVGTPVPFQGGLAAVVQLRSGALVLGGWSGTEQYSTAYEYLAPLYLYAR